MKIESRPAMTDTGTSCVYAPTGQWDEFIRILKKMIP